MKTAICEVCYKKNSQQAWLGLNYCKPCYDAHSKAFQDYNKTMGKLASKPDKILENLQIGDQNSSRDKDQLKFYGIKRILIAGKFLEAFHPDDFEYKQILIEDSPDEDIFKQFEETQEFINKSKEPILVHCAFGVSRSGAIVVAQLMKHLKLTFEKALQFAKEKRNQIHPNVGFVEQLKKYEKELKLP